MTTKEEKMTTPAGCEAPSAKGEEQTGLGNNSEEWQRYFATLCEEAAEASRIGFLSSDPEIARRCTTAFEQLNTTFAQAFKNRTVFFGERVDELWHMWIPLKSGQSPRNLSLKNRTIKLVEAWGKPSFEQFYLVTVEAETVYAYPYTPLQFITSLPLRDCRFADSDLSEQPLAAALEQQTGPL
jgi:hypothetical protein